MPPVSKPNDVKQTEDLLAGFDRTGRTPKTPATRDFVDYHLQPPPRVAGPPRVASPTFVIRRGDKALPGWLVWGGAVLAMLGGGALVAYLVTRSAPPPLRFSPPHPSAGATVPVAPSSAVVEPPRPVAEPTTEASTAPVTSPPIARPKAPPRSDFARKL